MVKKKLDQVVYEYVVNQIERGEILEREHITEQNVADTLEISRTPVRKAFNRLVEDNHLEMIENAGVRVKMQSLTITDFQDRFDLFERLLNHYLFDLEKKEINFDVEQLLLQIDEINTVKKQETHAFENNELIFWDEVLKYSDNAYAKKVMIQTMRECLKDDGYTYDILKNSRSLTVKHLEALAEYLDANDYPNARREVRIFLNQLKLNVIEKGLNY